MKRNILFLLFIFFIILSCKKKNNTLPTYTFSSIIANARISHVLMVISPNISGSSIDSTTYRITYNTDNMVDSMIIYNSQSPPTFETRTFNYYNDSFRINHFYPNGGSYNIIYVNSNGQITLDPWNYTFSYNQNGQLISIGYLQYNVHQNGWIVSGYQYYIWNADNYIKVDNLDSADSQIYTYDLSRQGQTGDAGRIPQFLTYGRSCLINKNTPEIAYSDADGNYYNCNYQYDSIGRITCLQYNDVSYYYQYY